MKTHQLCKKALANPHLYSPGELEFFRMWLKERKRKKKLKWFKRKNFLEALYNSK